MLCVHTSQCRWLHRRMNAKAVPAGLHLAEGTRVTLMARRYINTKRRAKEFKASFLSPGRFTSLGTHAKFGNTPYWRLCFSVPNSRKETEELGHGLSRVLCVSNPLPYAAWTPVGSSLQGGAKSLVWDTCRGRQLMETVRPSKAGTLYSFVPVEHGTLADTGSAQQLLNGVSVVGKKARKQASHLSFSFTCKTKEGNNTL